MPNQYKIKRHKRVYKAGGGNRYPVLKGIGAILCICVLFFVGYSIADPVMRFINGDLRAEVDQQYEQDQSQAAAEQNSAPSSQPSSATSDPTKINFEDIRGYIVPHTVLTDDSLFADFITYAKGNNINTAILELKDETGAIYYNSGVSKANDIGAVADDSADLKQRVEALKAEGIQTIAKMQVFRDPLAAKKIKGSSVRYSKDVTSLWLDDSFENGGKPWINPESSEGLSYIGSLMSEMADCGVKYIIADSLHYPKGVGLKYAYFGPQSNDSRTAVLNEYIGSLDSMLSDKNCRLIVSYDATDYLEKSEMVFGGSPANITAEYIAPYISPFSFENGTVIGKEKIDNPSKETYKLTKAFIESLKSNILNGTHVLAILEYPKGGEPADQIRALSEQELLQYVLTEGTKAATDIGNTSSDATSSDTTSSDASSTPPPPPESSSSTNE